MNTPSIKLADLLKQIDLPYRFGDRIDGFKVRTIRDDQNQRVSVEAYEEDAFYIVHAANLLPEIVAALRELDAATRHAARLRVTSCGKTLEDAEARELEAYAVAQSALDRAENVLTEKPSNDQADRPDVETLEKERWVVACREIWLRQMLEETQKELKALCDKCDAFKLPSNQPHPNHE